MASNRGKIITITSTKGGVGKTTLTLNLAGVYHLLKKKVLIIDMDLYSGGILVSLNVDANKTIYNLVDDITNNRYKDVGDYIAKYNENIDILPCPKDPRQGSKINPKYIENIFNSVLYRYDVILVDTAHILNDINIVTLDYTDMILYVMTNDPVDLKNTKSFVAILKDIEKDNIKILLNNSVDLNKSYFSEFDIKNIIKRNIDYTISSSFFIENIDKYVLDGEILILNKKLTFRDRNDYKKLMTIAKDLIGADQNE